MPTLSAKLISEYGSGFNEKNLWRMVQFTECFPDKKIVVTLLRQLSWSHFVFILPVKDSLAEYKGQMELYLRWLDKYECKTGEDYPLGLILCAGKSNEQIGLLELSRSDIRVAQYLMELPPREMLENKLRQTIKIARERFISVKKLE